LETLYPVILPVPDDKRGIPPRERVKYLSAHARRALALSAQKTNTPLGRLRKDENGYPLPFDGTYWSLSHKPEYVCGVTAPARIGIDIEKIRPCKKALFKRTAGDDEWKLSDMDPFILFFRFWTAKEAVLKAAGTGCKDLSKCRVIQIIDANHLVVDYDRIQWPIEHCFFRDHIASIVMDSFRIQWVLETA